MGANGKGKEGAGKDYEVGYCKPPKHTRWKKGQPSPNPKGRPTGTRNLKTDLLDELGEQLLLREGDKPIRISKQRAMVKALAAKAIKGDTRAINVLVNLILRFQPIDAGSDELIDLSAEDNAILEAFLKRSSRGANGEQSDE